MDDTAHERLALVEAVRGLVSEWREGPPAHWENDTVPRYLDALAAWLADCEGYYARRGESVPENGWSVIADAMRAAAVYE